MNFLPKLWLFKLLFMAFSYLTLPCSFSKLSPQKKTDLWHRPWILAGTLRALNKLHICETTRWQVAVALSCHSQAASPPSHLVQRMRQEVKCDSSGWPTALPPLRPFTSRGRFFLTLEKLSWYQAGCCTKTSPVSYAKKSPEGKWSSSICERSKVSAGFLWVSKTSILKAGISLRLVRAMPSSWFCTAWSTKRVKS